MENEPLDTVFIIISSDLMVVESVSGFFLLKQTFRAHVGFLVKFHI